MTVLHTGSTKQFSDGWEAIFSGRKAHRDGSGKSAQKIIKRPTAKKKAPGKKKGKR